MRIMHINCVYKKGSTGKIIFDLEKYNKSQKIETIIIYGISNREKEEKKHPVLNFLRLKINTIYTYLTGYMYKGSLLATLKTIFYIKKYRPSIVHLHSINGHMVNIYMLLKFLKKNNIPTVITHHGEFFYTGSYTHVPQDSTQYITGSKEKIENAKKLTNSLFFDRTYKSIIKMKKSFENFNFLYITSVSPWVNERSRKSFVLKNYPHEVILNGVDIDIFKPRDAVDLKKQLRIENKKVILHVTSGFDNPIKGSKNMLDLASELENSEYILVFIGLEKNVILPKNCINIGKVENQVELSRYYSMADVTVITSKVETFSMVVAESLCCGTPVAGFKAGGPESIALKEFSRFVDYGDVKKLKKQIVLLSNLKNNEVSAKAHKKYSKDLMAKKYIEIYEKLLEKKEKLNV